VFLGTLQREVGYGRYVTVSEGKRLRAYNGCFYTHAHRLRLEKLIYIELPGSSNGYFKPILNPGGGLTSLNRFITVISVIQIQVCAFCFSQGRLNRILSILVA
jgi:hypothetical protein